MVDGILSIHVCHVGEFEIILHREYIVGVYVCTT